MAEAGEVREMWSWEFPWEEEPRVHSQKWQATGNRRTQWVPLVSSPCFWANEGEGVFATREAAIRYAIAEAERDREVLAASERELAAKVNWLQGMLEEGDKETSG